MELICLFHDSEEYGILRWTLEEIAIAIGCEKSDLQELIRKGVLKGTEKDGEKVSFSSSFSQRKGGPIQKVLIDDTGPLFYSSRMVRDEFIRKERGKFGYLSELNENVPRKKEDEKDTDKEPDKDTLSPSLSPSPTSSSASSSASSSSKKKTNPRAKNPRTHPPSAFVLPDWISSDAWNDFEDHRKTIRKPLTDKSRKLAVAELSKLRDLGYPPNDVLAQSILNGWTGLFPLKGFSRPSTNGSHPPRKKTLIEQVLEANGITAEDIQSDKEILDVDETAY